MTQVLEYLKMALSNIRSNKMRSFLTMLGVIIGISSVILIMSVGNGAKNVITDSLAGIAEGQLMVYSQDSDYIIDKEDIDMLQANVKGIRAVNAVSSGNGTTSCTRGDFSVEISGVTEGYQDFDTNGLKLGRYFSKDEIEEGALCCIIDETTARRMFGSTNILGMTIEVDIWGYNMELTVVGIQKVPDDSQVNFFYDDTSVTIITPATIFQRIYDMTLYGYDRVSILAEKGADTHTIAIQTMNLLSRRHGCSSDDEIYRVENFQDTMTMVENVLSIVTAIVSTAAAISLLVGGIGVMNIMLVSVTERTREIGIRKALGAKTASIMQQFLFESAIITLLGGIIGVLLGIGNSYLIAAVVPSVNPALKFTPAISWKAILMATLFSTVIGLFFGIYPAKKAAKLSPIEALRRD